MRFRPLALAAILTASLSSGARAQEDPLFKLDRRSRLQIDTLRDSARTIGLDTMLIRSIALQGIASHADGPKIVQVLRLHFTKLVEAKTILGTSNSTDIVTGADALKAGLHADDLRKFKPVNGRSPSKALVFLTDLVQKQGLPRDELIDAFAKLWKDGARDSDFEGLWVGIEQDILSGVAPNAALQNRVRSLPRTKPPAEQDEGTPQS